jgi:soluble lytic murein transglycosylase-like protein
MEKKIQNKELRGLPGGPNEIPVYTTGVFSMEGFRMDSPDVNNYQNIIPSGSITMKEKDGSPLRKGPIHGVDNLGNEQVMYPGFDYQFPGTEVTETLMAKMGGGLLDKTIKCGNCGWEWKAADGGSDIMDCHKCGGKGLLKAQDGTETKWLGNTLDKNGYITSATKGGNRISFTGNQRADEWINKQIDSGKFGFDPKTGATFPLKKPVKGLSKEDKFMATKQYTDLRAPDGFTTESQQAQIDKLPEWQQERLNDANEKFRKVQVRENMQEVYKNPLFYAPGAIALAPIAAAGLTELGIAASPYITNALATQLPGMAAVPGATVGNAITAGFAGHGLAHVGPDAVEMYKNPSWQNVFNLAMDVAEVAPVAGPAVKTIGKGLSATGKALGTESSLLRARPVAEQQKYMNTSEVFGSSDDLAKMTVKDGKPRATRFDAVTEVNPLSQAQAQNLAEQGRNAEIFKAFEEGANTIDDFVKSYTGDLSSAEGFKRLTQQEADYLRSIGFDEARIARQAEINAGARLNEIINIGNTNRAISKGEKAVDGVIGNNYNFNNASYTPNTGAEWVDDLFYQPGMDIGPFNLNKTKIGAKVLPGETSLGTMFNSNKPIAAHEIGGHGLQSGRKLPVDTRLKKLEPLDELNDNAQAAYDYFSTGSKGRESSAFLHELRQAMLDNKLIRNRYDYVSPETLERAQTLFDLRPSGTVNAMADKFHSNTRILDFMKPTKSNFNLLATELNKLPAMVPIGVAGAAGAAALPQEKYGGESLYKAQDGKETSWSDYINPMNWGVSDRDDDGDFKQAFRAARQAGEDEFMWHGTRYTTELKAAPTTTTSTKPAAPKGITPELLVRQAYRESTFNPKAVSPAGYKGLGQIGDQVIKDYKKANNITGTIDPFNIKQNSDVHKYSMNELYNSSFINKPGQSEEVRLAKTLAAYNWGRGNVINLLNDLKEDGVDIYNSLDWVDKLPKESRNYINDILLQKNTTFNTDFSKALSNQKNKPITKLYGFRNGGESKLGPLMKAYNRLPMEKKMGGAISNKKEFGGQLNSGNITMYKDYVKGNIGNEEQAVKNYDKLNRIHYSKAKELGMTAANYIMTYIVGNS